MVSNILRYVVRSGAIILFGVFETIIDSVFIIIGYFYNYLWSGLAGVFSVIISQLFIRYDLVSY